MNSGMSESKKKARDARRKLGLNEYEPVDVARMLRLIEGISLVRKPFEGKISGCFLRGKSASLIVINSARTLGHQHFTLAHEYYHLLFEPEVTGRVCAAEVFAARSPSEQNADDFAADFLIPEEGLEEAVYRLKGSTQRPLSIEDLIELEQFFGVSHTAMRVRLERLGYLNEAQSRQMETGVVRVARSLGFDVSLYMPTNDERIQSPYPALAKQALERGLISSGKYRELMYEGGFFDLVSGAEEDESAEVNGSQPNESKAD